MGNDCELVISALLNALRDEWPKDTPVADMVRYTSTAEELAAIQSRFS